MNNATNNFFRPHHFFYVSCRGMFDLEAASKNILHIVTVLTNSHSLVFTPDVLCVTLL